MLYLLNSNVCNGYSDCADGSDESNCRNLVPCSGYPDCEDEVPKFYCRSRYNCSSRLPYSVPESYVSDGIDDCSDGSDECPTFLDNNSFSSRHQLIKHLAFTISLWVIAIVGAIGNATVFSYTLRRLTKGRSLSLIEKTNLTLILNLNVADFLTSVYLLFIGGKAAEYSGVYCKIYLAWRTSFECTLIGSTAVLSAEASLLMLTLMTTQRLYSACHPFNNGIRMRWIAMGIVVVWFLSFLTAIIPSLLPHVFYDRYWIASKYFHQPLVRPAVFNKFFENLVYLTQSANFSSLADREDQQQFLADNFPQLKVLGNFGYYSENAVCIPHLYPPVGDHGWLYPTIIVTFNMAAFVYVVIAYYIIYRVSTKNSSGTEKCLITHRLQTRIAKLVAVNFTVWFSIGVLSYIQLSLTEEFPEVLYDVTGIVLFPLNSVINPLLYSDVFENFFLKMYKTVLGCIKPSEVNSSCIEAPSKTTAVAPLSHNR